MTEKHHPLEVAETDGTLSYVASTYSAGERRGL